MTGAVGSKVMIHIAGFNVLFTDRGSRDMALGSILWAVGVFFGKALD